MSLICAVPSYAELSAATGQDVIVIAGLSGTSLRLDKVVPVRRGNTVSFRAAALRRRPDDAGAQRHPPQPRG